MPRYHISEDGVPRICKAEKAKDCRAKGIDGIEGGAEHFNSAVKAIEYSEKLHSEKFGKTKTISKKKPVNNTKSVKKTTKKQKSEASKNSHNVLHRDLDGNILTVSHNGKTAYSIYSDLSNLSPSDRTDVYVFEALKDNESFSFGVPNNTHSNYYNPSGGSLISDDDMKKLKDFEVPVKKYKYSRKGENIQPDWRAMNDKGFSVKVVPGSFKNSYTYQFAGTYAEGNGEVEHLTATTIITDKEGRSISIPCNVANVNFSDTLKKMLKNNEYKNYAGGGTKENKEETVRNDLLQQLILNNEDERY